MCGSGLGEKETCMMVQVKCLQIFGWYLNLFPVSPMIELLHVSFSLQNYESVLQAYSNNLLK